MENLNINETIRKINEISGRLSAGCDLAYNKKGKYSV